MRIIKSLTLLTLIIALQSCNLTPLKPGIWKDDKIDADKRKDFHAMNDQLLKNIKTGDADAIENMLSKDLLGKAGYKRTIELIGNHMKEGDFSLNEEYYTVNNVKDGTFKNPDTDSLDLDYAAVAKEMYMAFLVPKAPLNKYMVTVVYGKFDYGWKIDKLEIQKYTENGKGTVALYQQAIDQLNKGYLIDASNSMAMAHDCGNPSEELKPLFNETMHVFYGKLIAALNNRYKYPLAIEGVSTKPHIFRVDNQVVNGGTYPAVCYLTSYDLRDTVAIKKENEQVKKVIGKVLPGIDKDKNYMIYSVYHQKPEMTSNAYSYDITVKLQ
jgi:hypothetical protein